MFSLRMARHRIAGDWYYPPSDKRRAAMQERRWRHMLHHVYHHSPYYRRYMQAQALQPETARLEDFPVLTKKNLLAHYDEILTVPGLSLQGLHDFLATNRDPMTLLHGRYYVIHTSGSSGSVLPMVFDEASWLEGCAPLFRFFKPRFREKTLFLGATTGHFAGISMALNHRRGVCPWFSRFEAIDINQPTRQWLAAVQAVQADVLVAYAGALRQLAEAQQAGELQIRPRALLSGGEALSRADAALLQDVFGVAPADIYASTEHLIMAYRARRDEALQFCHERLLIEAEGERTLVTNLGNLCLPLIRYAMGDVLGGVNGTGVDEVIGRQEHAPRFLNDHGEWDTIHPIVLVELYVPGLRAFQCQLLHERAFIFRVQCDPGASSQAVFARTEQSLREILAAKAMRQVQFTLEETSCFSPDPQTGKFRLILPPP